MSISRARAMTDPQNPSAAAGRKRSRMEEGDDIGSAEDDGIRSAGEEDGDGRNAGADDIGSAEDDGRGSARA